MIRALVRKYKERAQEVQTFISTIEKLNDIDVFAAADIKSVDMSGSPITFTLTDTDLQIYRASFYLMLYNLIESTTNEIIKEVSTTITEENLTIDMLSPKIHALYIDNLIGQKETRGYITTTIQNVIQRTLSKTAIELTSIDVHVSGNVTYEFLNKLVSSIGCRGRISGNIDSITETMGRVKEYRNKLAHGELSFVEVGRSKSIQDLKKDHAIVTKYLEEVVNNCVKYLDAKKYIK